MVNKENILSKIVMFAVIIAGLVFCFWFYRVAFNEPSAEANKTAVLKIKTDIYNKIVSSDSQKTALPLTDENFGRADPFAKY